MNLPQIEFFWKLKKFSPNDNQRAAILHKNGPLFLTAGPGSGKTRVLLWRTVNLIVWEKVDPSKIFLATFTEKAAHQLKEGLRGLLGSITNVTGVAYDITNMSIGTVHSICQEILVDSNRRFTLDGVRGRAPVLMDELGQYFKVYNRRFWVELLTAGGFHPGIDSEAEQITAQEAITKYLTGGKSNSRHYAVIAIIKLFNRFSEENLNPATIQSSDEFLNQLIRMYDYYCKSLIQSEKIQTVDFSLLQQKAFNKIRAFNKAGEVYDHIIVDEYQDTNAIQEQIYFELAKNSKNICVVGDDDQALYRFRGATVENLVEFEDRCKSFLGVKPTKIALNTNYRSMRNIVHFYNDFILRTDWKKPDGTGHYRVMDKNIIPHNQADFPAVVRTPQGTKDEVCAEIAQFVHDLKKSGKIEDYNQVAFLFPSLKSMGKKSSKVESFENELNKLGIKVFAPRAGRFLDVSEAKDIFGLIFSVLGRPSHAGRASLGLKEFRSWQMECLEIGSKLIAADQQLREFVEDRKSDIAAIQTDYVALMKVVTKQKWDLHKPVKTDMLRTLASASGLSAKCKSTLQKQNFIYILQSREKAGKPFQLSYVINRVTSLDWSILDLFYQLNGFRYFQRMFELAEDGTDEGPIINLGMITDYLARFMEQYTAIITASYLNEDKFINTFVASYLYAIYRLGESEFEDKEDPFPKGRVPFLTIHQAKGLEFPYVVLGSLRKDERGADPVEVIIRELLHKEGEPLEKITNYDKMRVFYVGLSRAKQLTILPHFNLGKINTSQEFIDIFAQEHLPFLSAVNLKDLPEIQVESGELGKNYSYTADFLNYQQCPRKYMIFRKYGFVPSRSQTMFFGSLVHQTIEDLHHLLISEKKKKEAKA